MPDKVPAVKRFFHNPTFHRVGGKWLLINNKKGTWLDPDAF